MAMQMIDEWDQIDGQEVEVQDAFSARAGSTYVQPTFFRGGVNKVVHDPRASRYKAVGEAQGWMYEIEKLPQQHIDALDLLCQEGKAEKVLVEHKDKDKKSGAKRYVEYYRVFEDTFSILAHATISPSSSAKSVDRQLGIAGGVWINYKEGSNTYDADTVTEVLAVHLPLLHAGLIDNNGLPVPVLLRLRGISSSEFMAALGGHGKLIQWVRSNTGQTKAQLWEYVLPLHAGDDKVPHGSGEDTFDVFPVIGHDENISQEYVDSLRIPADLCKIIRKLVLELKIVNGKAVVSPGGPAIEWCRQEYIRFAENAAMYNPEGEKLPLGKKKPATARMLNRRQLADASLYATGQASVQQQAPDDNREEEKALRDRLEGLREWFAGKGMEEWVETCDYSLALFDSPIFSAEEIRSTIAKAGEAKMTVLRSKAR